MDNNPGQQQQPKSTPSHHNNDNDHPPPSYAEVAGMEVPFSYVPVQIAYTWSIHIHTASAPSTENRSSAPHSHYRAIVIEQEEVAPLLSPIDIERQFPVAALFFIFGWYVNPSLI